MFSGIRQFFVETNQEIRGGWLAMLVAAAANALFWCAVMPESGWRLLFLCITGFAIGWFWPKRIALR